ncbi:MAG: glycoside hydrolase family 5 protein [Acidimicrobiales bacterium]
MAPAITVAGNQLFGSSGQPVRLVGVDASGTEDACIADRGFSWGPFDAEEARQIASWHANVVRVPMNEDCWLGINGAPAQYSGALYQAAIEAWVHELNAAGMVAILDLHWSAPGDIKALTQWPMADTDHSITFWSQVATAFKDDASVVYDLFNEPYLGLGRPTAADWSCWRNGCLAQAKVCNHGVGDVKTKRACTAVTFRAAGMQQMLDAVRQTGARQPVMVGGLNWAGDPCGVKDKGGNGGACMWLAFAPSDPLHQLVASFHTYNWTACRTRTCWHSSVLPVAQQVPVVTGEIGEKDCSAEYITKYVEWANEHGVSYLFWGWQPARPGASCASQNDGLINNWSSGQPSTISPSGPFVRSALEAANPRI